MLSKKIILTISLLLITLIAISTVTAEEITNETDTVSIIEDNTNSIIETTDDAIITDSEDDYDDENEQYYFTYSNMYDNAYVNLTLPEKANGNMVVSTVEYDDEDEPTYNQIADVKLTKGHASYKLPFKEFDYYEIKAEYTGTDYNVETLEVGFDLIPQIIYAEKIWINDDNYIQFHLPQNQIINVSIYKDDYEEEFDKITIRDGSKYKLNNLQPGDSSFYFEFYNEDDIWIGSYYLYQDIIPLSPNYQLQIKALDALYGSRYIEMHVELPTVTVGDSSGTYGYDTPVTIIIDGDVANAINATLQSEICFETGNLDYGNHELELIWYGDDYFKKSTSKTNFTVSYIACNVESQWDYGQIWDEMTVELIDNATGYLLLYIDDNLEAISWASVNDLSVQNVPVGQHTYKLVYSGDENYAEYTRTRDKALLNR